MTLRGLEDQLLGIVIVTEKSELELERTKLMEEVTSYKKNIKELEDNLLLRYVSASSYSIFHADVHPTVLNLIFSD